MSYSFCLMSPIGDHMCDGFLSDLRRKRGKGSKQCNQGNGLNTQITGCIQVVSFLQPLRAESPFSCFTDVEPKSFDQVHQNRWANVLTQLCPALPLNLFPQDCELASEQLPHHTDGQVPGRRRRQKFEIQHRDKLQDG